MPTNSYILKTVFKNHCDKSRRNWCECFKTIAEAKKALWSDPSLRLVESDYVTESGAVTDIYEVREGYYHSHDLRLGEMVDCGDYYLKIEEV